MESMDKTLKESLIELDISELELILYDPTVTLEEADISGETSE